MFNNRLEQTNLFPRLFSLLLLLLLLAGCLESPAVVQLGVNH